MANNYYDAIVIGVGSMGSSTCYYLAKKGFKVLGLEQFAIPNELSSHTGQSRIIRKAYYEHPDYVPLLQRAYKNWEELEKASGEQIYYKTGLLYAGTPGGELMQGVKLAAKVHAIEVNLLDHAFIHNRYPSFQVPDHFEILFEPDAGFVRPELAIQSYCSLAIQQGAEIKSNVKVVSWQKLESGYQVNTMDENYFAEKLIFTSGPWAASLLPEWSSALKVTRQILAWMDIHDHDQFGLGQFPCWMIEEDGFPGVFYGFPILPSDQFEGPSGFKLAHHYPGEITDPDHLDRTPREKDESLLVEFMHRHFPNQYRSTLGMKACMYTNSPDENFILDFLPGHDQDIVVATGFSGHGFKFASVVGEIMSDLAINGKTDLPIDFLRINRLNENHHLND